MPRKAFLLLPISYIAHEDKWVVCVVHREKAKQDEWIDLMSKRTPWYQEGTMTYRMLLLHMMQPKRKGTREFVSEEATKL